MKVWTKSALENRLVNFTSLILLLKLYGLFSSVCLAVGLTKPLKMEIMYRRDMIVHSCLLVYENIIDISYGCGSQDHRFDSCVLNSEKIAFKIENVQVIP